MSLMRITCALCVTLMLFAAPGALLADQPPAAAQDGYVPVDQLSPVDEQLPAAPLVAAAYGIAWAAILVYLWSIWRRLDQVNRELTEVSRRLEPGARQ